jgi:hypothetical protein
MMDGRIIKFKFSRSWLLRFFLNTKSTSEYQVIILPPIILQSIFMFGCPVASARDAAAMSRWVFRGSINTNQLDCVLLKTHPAVAFHQKESQCAERDLKAASRCTCRRTPKWRGCSFFSRRTNVCNHLFQNGNQVWKVHPAHIKDGFRIQIKIMVADDVAHSFCAFPVNLRIAV